MQIKEIIVVLYLKLNNKLDRKNKRTSITFKLHDKLHIM